MLGLANWDFDRPVSALVIVQRQLVEIARLLACDARGLILDKATATLSDSEIERIFGVFISLRDQGLAVIYITHPLSEVLDLCDSVTVLRRVGTELAGRVGVDRRRLKSTSVPAPSSIESCTICALHENLAQRRDERICRRAGKIGDLFSFGIGERTAD